MLPSRAFQPGDYWQGRMPGGGGSFLPNYGGLHPMLGAGLMAPGAPAPAPYVPPVTAPNAPPPPPPPAPMSPLLAMAMQQQMGAAQPQASGMPQAQGMGMPQGQPMPSGGQYQNFIPPIQATPFNYQGGQQPMPMGGMWNQVAQQMAGPGFMQPGTSAMYSGFNPSLVAAPQGPHNIAAAAPAPAAPAGGGLASLSPYLPAMGY